MSHWKIRAEGGGTGTMVADLAEVRKAMAVFLDPEYTVELISLPKGKVAFHKGDDLDGICQSVLRMPDGFGMYWRINPVKEGLSKAANNGDVICRRWLYIDVDPVKAEEGKDESATEEEKDRTRDVMDDVNRYLHECGWPLPIIVDSGNGVGIFHRIDLPNDKDSQVALRKLLVTLSNKFSGPNGTIDKSVHNANRLAKVPGTWARKGTSTAERPHRPCRLTFIPSVGEVVSREMIDAASEQEQQEERRPERTYTTTATTGNGYVRRAIELECSRILLARHNGEGRNNALNRAAFSLGQLVAGGVANESEVRAALTDAALASGLGDDANCGESGIRATINSGLEAGKKHPRGVPERNEPKPTFSVPASPREPLKDGESLTVRMSEVTPKEVKWLIPDRIPVGFITILAGRTAIGKSYVACDLIARLSTGGEVPCSTERLAPGGSLIISEDSHDYVLAPRLIDAGANLKRIHALTWRAMGEYHLANTEMLSKACDEVEGGVSLVVIDPPTNFTAGIDDHKNTEVRQLVMGVVEWALERDVAVLFILHTNKAAKGVEALNRIMGSVAWVTTSRIAHVLCTDPNADDRSKCLWIPVKSNISRMAEALSYQIVRDTDGTRVKWLGIVDTSADDAMDAAFGPRKRRDVAAGEWLIERFREKLEWESEELIKTAHEHGISRNAIWEAKKQLNLPKPRKVTSEIGNTSWVWWVPADWLLFGKGKEPEEIPL